MLNTSVDITSGLTASAPAMVSGPLVGKPELEAQKISFNERLESILRGTANAYGAVVAEFWLLDNPTQQLSCRASWEKKDTSSSIPDSTAAARPRPLVSADADVAALAGGVVVLEHPAEILQWHCHHTASSAVCLPVSSDRTIHGTLWLFFDRSKEFCNRELEMLEIVAGRLAVEIERDALLHRSTAESSPLKPSVDNQANVADPNPSELEIANWSSKATKTAESFWHALPHGKTLTISSSIVATPGTTDEQAAQAIQSMNTLAYELANVAEDAGELLTELNRQLNSDKNFNAGVTIGIALLDNEGTGTVATAGPSVMLQVRAATLQSILGEATPLGWDAHACYESTSVELMVRERLLLLTGTPQLSSPTLERQFTDTFRAPTADAHRAMSAQGCIERLLRVNCKELGAITAIRRV